MDEYRRVTQNLRADNTRLKDVTLDLRTQNEDLTQRALDDAGRIAGLEEAVERLERSTAGYQAERERMASAFETLKRQVRMSASASPGPQAGVPARLEAFASTHPGWSYDAGSRTLSAAPDTLYLQKGDRLNPAAAETLKELAALLGDATAEGLNTEVAGPGLSPVIRAGFGPEHAAKPNFLSAAQAARVREALVAGALDPARVRVAPSDAGREGEPRVEIRLRPTLAEK
jgi:hypothetical protein